MENALFCSKHREAKRGGEQRGPLSLTTEPVCLCEPRRLGPRWRRAPVPAGCRALPTVLLAAAVDGAPGTARHPSPMSA